MTLQELMERAGITQTGRAIAYLKEALDEMALLSPTHTTTIRMDLNEDQRFYSLPKEAINILDIRMKDHDNEQGLYRSIPRLVNEPGTEDSDGI